MTSDSGSPSGRDNQDLEGLGLVIVQLGSHVARRFGELLAPLGIEQRHAGMLSRLAANEGKSQQAIGGLAGLNASRMVFLIDELEQRGLVERRRNPADRRSHALYLTDRGRDMLRRARQVMNEHERRLGASLTESERRELASLLRRVAGALSLPAQGLPAQGLPA